MSEGNGSQPAAFDTIAALIEQGVTPAALGERFTKSQLTLFAATRMTTEWGNNRHLPADAVTGEQAAGQVGVSLARVFRARKILRSSPGLVAPIAAGRLTLHAAMRIVALVPPEQYESAVAKVARGTRGVGAAHLLGLGRQRRAPVVSLTERMSRALDQLEGQIDNLSIILQEPHDADRPWTSRLRGVRRALSRIIHQEEGMG